MHEVSDRQKLVNICFEVAMTVRDNNKLKGMSNEDLCTWVAGQLKACGFETIPVGCSWGMLIENKKKSVVIDEEPMIEEKRPNGYGWQEYDDGSEPSDNNIFRND